MHQTHYRSSVAIRTRLLLRLAPVIVGIAIAGCNRKEQAPSARQAAAVNRRLARYELLVTQMAHDSIASLFLPNGVLANAGQPSITGREEIREYLKSLDDYYVLEERMMPESTVVDADSVTQHGTFEQRYRSPKGDTVEVSGDFRAVWLRDSDNRWKMRCMETTTGT
ncbi:MAG: hypothetical protein MNPFHGCM_00948 [Gemmatimonadaceae bacterium]|nr:hypothetical protein [Gemmatimonadaceae bacterium]